MEIAIQDGTYPNIHSILIARNGETVYEKYWAGRDKKEGKDLGVIPHAAADLHGIQSISKSITSACVGIAIEQGKIKSVEQKIFEFFPEYAAQNIGLKAEITIKDLLTMTAGFKWNEEDYSDPTNDENQMGIAPDPVSYILSRPMENAPGKTFNYNGGETQLLAALVQRATGKRIDAFAKKYLFTPLGITDFKWTSTIGSEVLDAFSGLYLRSRDLMKFGLLYLNNGRWKSKQIVPADWVEKSFVPYMLVDDGSDPRFGKSSYGFQWWLFSDSIFDQPIFITACIGNGGQRVFIDKTNGLVVIFTGGSYRMPDRYLNPYKIMKQFIYPALYSKRD